MPYKIRSKFQVLSTQNTIQITNKNSNGYFITDINSFKGKLFIGCQLSKNIPSAKRLTFEVFYSQSGIYYWNADDEIKQIYTDLKI